MTAGRLACALLGAALLAPDAAARELWRRGEASLELSGSVKEIVRITRGTDGDEFQEIASTSPACVRALRFPACPAFRVVGDKDVWQSLMRVRTRLDARVNPHLSAVVTYDHELRFGILDTLGRDLGEGLRTDSIFDLEWDVRALGMPSDHRRWRHLLYRAYLKLETSGLEAVVGRQRIPWGVGRLWNPVDRFNAIPPLAIEADQSLGVDAVDVRWNFSGFSFLEAVYQPNGNRDDRAYALRLHGVLADVDYSLLGGRWEGAWAAGLDLAGNLGDSAFRIEAIWTSPTREVWPVGADRPRELASFWQVVVSVDHSFDLGRGLYVLVEHLYNGNALGFGEGSAGTLLPFFETTREPPPGLPPAPAPLAPPPGPTAPPPASLPPRGPFVRPASAAIFGGSRVVSFARHQTGIQVGYDLTAILRLDVLAIYDWNGESAVFAPILAWSPTGSLELTLGAQLFVGKRLSQYGSQEHLAYAIAEWFF